MSAPAPSPPDGSNGSEAGGGGGDDGSSLMLGDLDSFDDLAGGYHQVGGCKAFVFVQIVLSPPIRLISFTAFSLSAFRHTPHVAPPQHTSPFPHHSNKINIK